MDIKDVKIGEIYKCLEHGGYAKVIEIVPPKTKDNTFNYTKIRCKWTTDSKAKTFGSIKLYRDYHLEPIEEKEHPHND